MLIYPLNQLLVGSRYLIGAIVDSSCKGYEYLVNDVFVYVLSFNVDEDGSRYLPMGALSFIKCVQINSQQRNVLVNIKIRNKGCY